MLEKQEWDCFPTTSLGTKTLQILKGVPSNNIQWPPREWHWSYEIGSCISHGQLMGIGQSHQISAAVPKIDRYDVFRISIKSKFRLSVSCSPMASHAVIVRVSTHVPAPLTSAKLSGKEHRPITAHFQTWEVHFGPWEILLMLDSAPEKIRKVLKGEDLTLLEKTTQLTHMPLYWRLPSWSHWKNYLRGLICWTEVGFTTKQ